MLGFTITDPFTMIDIIKEIILEFQSGLLETGTRRHLHYELVPRKAFVCIGVRRAGKSTFLHQIISSLIDQGVPKEAVLYINFFDDRLKSLRSGDLGKILDAFYSLYPKFEEGQKIYCFFDEIQETEHWEPFVERVLRTENAEVFLTGSSAKLLSKEIATEMRGRSLAWELFPFSFAEYLSHQNVQVDPTRISKKERRQLEAALADYIQCGGFPEVLGLNQPLMRKIHQEYYKTIIHRDIIDRFEVVNPKAVERLSFHLLSSMASLYTINRLTNLIRTQGFKVTKAFVAESLSWFEDAYFLFSLEVLDESAARRQTNPKKIYAIDHALAHSVVGTLSPNTGRALENMVFLELRRRSEQISYYKTKRGGYEVDFAVLKNGNMLQLIQVADDLSDEKTRAREIRALVEASKESGSSENIIVTRTERDSVKRDDISIEIVPLWRFLVGGTLSS